MISWLAPNVAFYSVCVHVHGHVCVISLTVQVFTVYYSFFFLGSCFVPRSSHLTRSNLWKQKQTAVQKFRDLSTITETKWVFNGTSHAVLIQPSAQQNMTHMKWPSFSCCCSLEPQNLTLCLASRTLMSTSIHVLNTPNIFNILYWLSCLGRCSMLSVIRL